MSIPIAINGTSLLTPLTGVGQYTRNLTIEIEKDATFTPHYFYGPMWDMQRIDQATLECRIKEKLRIRINPRSASRFFIYAQTYALGLYTHFNPTHVAQYKFNRGIKEMDIALYHEPNFVPYKYNGPIINTIHDLSVLRFPDMHPKKRLKQIGKQLPEAIERSDFIVTVSNFIAQEVVDTFSIDPSKVVAIHNGVNESFRPHDKFETYQCLTSHGLKHEHYILAVGTLEPRKNLSSLVKAYEMLPPSVRRKFPLVIVGMKGWHYSELTDTMKPLIKSGDIKLLGYLTEKELIKIYAGSTMLVYPSVYEGFGLPPLEAMACGVPVIASNRSSLPEVVGNAGLLIEPEDVDSINEAITQVLNDGKLRTKMHVAGLKQSQQFSWEKCAKETMAVYKKTIGA